MIGLAYAKLAWRETIAQRAIRLGARLRLVTTLSGLTETQARKVMAALGENPRGGQQPWRPEWFSTGRRPLHATVICTLHQKIEASEACERFLNAYETYVDYCHQAGLKPLLDIHRAWSAIRLVLARQLLLHSCVVCHDKYYLPLSPPPEWRCHECKRAGLHNYDP